MSRQYPYVVKSSRSDLIQVIHRSSWSRVSIASKGKNALTNEFREMARKTFQDKWTVSLKHYLLLEDGTTFDVEWVFRFRNANDALLMKLMS